MASFEQLGIAKERALSLREEGITEATPIQEGAIPVILQGSDVICQAQTGTGKTLAFLLPMLERTRADREEVQGLILTPTRELALQITTELKNRLASKDEFSVLAVYGGQDVESQLRKLKRGVHMVVATPGRLLDHIRRGTIKLGAVKMLVLDEADQMLHMGFLTEVEEILTQMPYRKQTMLFSATMPAGVRSLAARFMIEPKDITVRAPQVTVKGIRQLSVEVGARNKEEQMKRLLEEHNPYLGVIFCRTKKRASALNQYLQENGFNSDELHGDLSQAKREQVMKRFRDAKLHLLVATDVAARGLDVEGVTHVFNYDIPENAESYIHRIGRTGRAGEDGLAITLVSPHDRLELAAIEKGIQMSIPREGLAGGAPARAARDFGGRAEGGRAGARGGDGRRGGSARGAGRGAQGGRSGQVGRSGRSAAGGRSGGAYAGAAKRGSGTDEQPQWGANRAEAPRSGRTRYSTPAGEAAGERGTAARGRGASAARGGAGRDAEYGARSGSGETRGRGASAARGGAGRDAEYGARSGSGETRGRGASAARGGAGRDAEHGARSGSGETRGRGASAPRSGAGRDAEYGARSGSGETRGRGASAPRGGAGRDAEQGARSGSGETRGRGASAPRGGGAPQFPGSGDKNRGGRNASGGAKGGRSGGKQGAGGRTQRGRTR